ncbi:hypothetical protein ACHQM5_008751 [Ranunculus cassubicifolius]
MDVSKIYVFVNILSFIILLSLPCIILICSWYCFPEANSALDVQMELEKPTLPPAEFEPMIVVTMAGDTVPTYLAKPVPAIQSIQQDV